MKTFDRITLISLDGTIHTGHITCNTPGKTRILVDNEYTIILEQQSWFKVIQSHIYDPHFPPSLGTWEFP
jgi:hypothetical protein